MLECVPSGFEPREGVEEPVEAGLFVVVEVVGSIEQQKPGPEQFGAEGGFDAGGFSALQVTTHQRQSVGEPAHDMEPVQHVAGAAEMDLDGAAVGLRSVGDDDLDAATPFRALLDEERRQCRRVAVGHHGQDLAGVAVLEHGDVAVTFTHRGLVH